MKSRIIKATPLTDTPFVRLYRLEGINKKGNPHAYYLASRTMQEEKLKLHTHQDTADGVVIYALDAQGRIVLVRQYRCSIDDYIYELPAGLVEPGEDYRQAAIREMEEETGLTFVPEAAPAWMEKPLYTTIGLTDEACATVYGRAYGEISREHLEENEELEIVLADRREAKRILKEERVALMCGYQLMHYLHDRETFGFLREADEEEKG